MDTSATPSPFLALAILFGVGTVLLCVGRFMNHRNRTKGAPTDLAHRLSWPLISVGMLCYSAVALVMVRLGSPVGDSTSRELSFWAFAVLVRVLSAVSLLVSARSLWGPQVPGTSDASR